MAHGRRRSELRQLLSPLAAAISGWNQFAIAVLGWPCGVAASAGSPAFQGWVGNLTRSFRRVATSACRIVRSPSAASLRSRRAADEWMPNGSTAGDVMSDSQGRPSCGRPTLGYEAQPRCGYFAARVTGSSTFSSVPQFVGMARPVRRRVPLPFIHTHRGTIQTL